LKIFATISRKNAPAVFISSSPNSKRKTSQINAMNQTNTVGNYPHPQKRLVSRDIARAWPDKSARLTRKIDGQFSQFQINGSVLLGELVKDKSGLVHFRRPRLDCQAWGILRRL
jgi:hypothetical protein